MSNAKLQNENKHLFEILKKSLFLLDAPDEVLELVASELEMITFKSGAPIFIAKEIDQKMYFVASGSVEIVSFQ